MFLLHPLLIVLPCFDFSPLHVYVALDESARLTYWMSVALRWGLEVESSFIHAEKEIQSSKWLEGTFNAFFQINGVFTQVIYFLINAKGWDRTRSPFRSCGSQDRTTMRAKMSRLSHSIQFYFICSWWLGEVKVFCSPLSSVDNILIGSSNLHGQRKVLKVVRAESPILLYTWHSIIP